MGTVLLIVVAAALAVALAVTVVRLRRIEAADRQALQEHRVAAAADHDRLTGELRRSQSSLQHTTEMLGRVRDAWRAEREWSRELRAQMARLGGGGKGAGFGRGASGADVRELVLETAIKLAEGDRGLLLSREDRDADGELDVVVARGFEHDPSHSRVVQRFARAVLERDRIIREDEPATGGDRTPADEEIQSLVAIPLYLRDRFDGVVICANRSGGFEDVGDDVLLALGDHAAAALQHGHLRHALQDANRAAVRILVEAVAAADPVLHRESSQLSVHALHLARAMKLDEREREILICAVLLRAVGNLALPERVLSEPGPITAQDRELVELHPRIGFTIIGQALVLRDVATTVLYHHERYDGGGYPAGLRGDDIPVLARALAALETFSAITHQRPYRDARTIDEACEELVAAAGTQLDPEIAQLLVEEVRLTAGAPPPELGTAIADALPFDPVAAADSVLGPLGGPATDGLTLLGDHRALQHAVRDVLRAGDDGRGATYALALVQLEGLGHLNQDASFVVGDRVIHAAARSAGRVAVRLGGTAYRASGRRLALLLPLREGVDADRIAAEIGAEFAGGPDVRTHVVACRSGESGEQLIARARRGLSRTDST